MSIAYLHVAIIDDDFLYSDELRKALVQFPEIASVTVAGSIYDFLENPNRGVPNVILLDTVLSGINNISGIVRLRESVPNAEIVILTTLADSESIFYPFTTVQLAFFLRMPKSWKLKMQYCWFPKAIAS